MNTIKRIAVSTVTTIVGYLQSIVKNIKGVILMTSATAGIASFLVNLGLATVGALSMAALAVLVCSR